MGMLLTKYELKLAMKIVLLCTRCAAEFLLLFNRGEFENILTKVEYPPVVDTLLTGPLRTYFIKKVIS